jgi:hypothetical protein
MKASGQPAVGGRYQVSLLRRSSYVTFYVQLPQKNVWKLESRIESREHGAHLVRRKDFGETANWTTKLRSDRSLPQFLRDGFTNATVMKA